ncbi:TetR/AcrR family transcriptional regulator [Nocardia sp. BSTN01]|uniref:TetR/AcrR family transcriptional regulator n=1 Tax=Nocardia sp. BSTN01 TaxID=2783665 RepID=UPI00188FD47C|nr:TetR/AcrR family transcriptional regulator [Nocardia sp. BSTN01]MBF4997394.1 TetR/AcrR family transcriptional regulator [Nocardia sp. BSTN01]
MSSCEAVGTAVTVAAKYTAAQRRVIVAAFELFARHGVSGTSLQMIADVIGVTKAAVYHQFKTKDDIVHAVADAEMARLEASLAEAEAQDSDPAARDALLGRVVDIAVQRRRLYGVMQNDPYMARFLAEHTSFQDLMERLFAVLSGERGDGRDTDMRVRAAMLYSAIGGAAVHPMVVDLDDAALREHLIRFARGLFQLPVVR